jgi:tRNA(fMet)-specific endonuclease VapC
MIVIDSDVLIEIFDRKSREGEIALNKIKESNEPFSITAITLHEVLYGLLKHAKTIDEMINLPVINYDKEDAEISARLELEAEKKGRKIFRIDAMIAAITINNNAKLYTNNMKHFEVFNELELF